MRRADGTHAPSPAAGDRVRINSGYREGQVVTAVRIFRHLDGRFVEFNVGERLGDVYDWRVSTL